MKPLKNENSAQAVPTQQEPAAEPNPDRGMIARVREQLIEADLADVTRPNQLLVRGITGRAVVAVGYADPTLHEVVVMRDFRFSPMKPGTDPEKPGLFRAWENLRECPKPYTDKLGHTVWMFTVNPANIQVPNGIELRLPEISEHPNLGTREHPLHGTVRRVVQLPRESWMKTLQDDQEIQRVFKLDSWVYLERQPETNWLVSLVEFVGDIPHDFNSKHDRLQVTVAARPAAFGWMTQADAAAACEAARFNRKTVVKNKIAAQAAPPQSKAEELRRMI